MATISNSLCALSMMMILAVIPPGAMAQRVTNITPAWSPNSASIAFVSIQDRNPDVHVMKLDGSARRNLTKHDAVDFGVLWVKQGQQLSFVSRQDGKSDIYLMNPDGTGLRKLTQRGDILTSAHSWSPDGSKVVYGAGTHADANLYMLEIDGMKEVPLTDTQWMDAAPSWSPDGTQIAFQSERSGNFEIYVMNITDGSPSSDPVPLTNHPAEDGQPQWSPDGSRIAFFSNRDGNTEVYVMRADGTEQKNLTNNPASDSGVSWSPDGTRIAFSSDRYREQHEIFVMNVDGSAPIRLTEGKGSNQN